MTDNFGDNYAYRVKWDTLYLCISTDRQTKAKKYIIEGTSTCKWP